MEEKYPYFREGMGTNFPDFPHLMDFATFFHTMGN